MSPGAVIMLKARDCVMARRDGGKLRCVEVETVRHGASAIVKGSHPVVVGRDVENREGGLMFYPWQVVRRAGPGEALVFEMRGRHAREEKRARKKTRSAA